MTFRDLHKRVGIGEESGSGNSFQRTRIFWQSFGAENYILELVFWPKINNPIYSCTLGLVRVVIRSILNIQILDNVAENTRKQKLSNSQKLPLVDLTYGLVD